MIAYKVVRKSDTGLYYSVVAYGSDFCTTYKIGEVARPKIGKLFVFDDLLNAERFFVVNQHITLDHFIFEVEVPHLDRLLGAACRNVDYHRFWLGEPINEGPTPYGTRVTPEVTLIREIKL